MERLTIEKFYNFSEKPFNMAPSTGFYFPTPKQERILDKLLIAINEKKCFSIVTGEVGSGKTMLCRALIERLDSSTRAAFVVNTHLGRNELLIAILESLGIEYKTASRAHLLIDLNGFLKDQASKDKKVVLVVDEAQTLRRPLFEEIWMLSNLKAADERLIQVVLVGQPEVQNKIKQSKLSEMDSESILFFELESLNRQETEGYIKHRLQKVGDRYGETFSAEAINEIFRHSSGVPRLINLGCHNALTDGIKHEEKRISGKVASEAMLYTLSHKPKDKPQSHTRSTKHFEYKNVAPPREEPQTQVATAQKEVDIGNDLSQEIIDTFFKKESPQEKPIEKPPAKRKLPVGKLFPLLIAYATLAALALSVIIIILYNKRSQSVTARPEIPQLVSYTEDIIKNAQVDRFKVEEIFFEGDAKKKSSFSENAITLTNFGSYGRASLVMRFNEPLDLENKNLLILARAKHGTKKLNLILKDSKNASYEFKGESFSVNWSLKNVYLGESRDIDLKNIKELKLEFGRHTAGNEKGSTIYLKNITTRRAQAKSEL